MTTVNKCNIRIRSVQEFLAAVDAAALWNYKNNAFSGTSICCRRNYPSGYRRKNLTSRLFKQLLDGGKVIQLNNQNSFIKNVRDMEV